MSIIFGEDLISNGMTSLYFLPTLFDLRISG